MLNMIYRSFVLCLNVDKGQCDILRLSRCIQHQEGIIITNTRKNTRRNIMVVGIHQVAAAVVVARVPVGLEMRHTRLGRKNRRNTRNT